MADYHLDSSALVKRYIRESGSDWVSGLFDPALNNEVFIAAITPVEIIAAITRRAREGTITGTDSAAARRPLPGRSRLPAHASARVPPLCGRRTIHLSARRPIARKRCLTRFRRCEGRRSGI